MSVDISDLVSVDIAISSNAVATDGYGPLVFMTDEFQPVAGENPIRIYTSYKGVQEDWDSGGTEILAAATAWYSQKPVPKTFLVGSIPTSQGTPATAGTLKASVAAVLADIKAITSGSMTFSVDGKSAGMSNVDFSGATDLAAVVTILQNQLPLVTVSQNAGVFTFTSTTTGSNSSVTVPAATPLATALKLTSALNAVSTRGVAGTTVTDSLGKMAQAAGKAKQSFFYVAVDRAIRDTDDLMDVAAWAEANAKVFGLATASENVLTTGDTTNSFYKAQQRNFQRTICVYDASANGNEYPEVSILGRASTVNFNVANSALVLAYKKGPGITTADLTSGQLVALESYNGNAFINVGDNVLFYNGIMADGTWFDTVQGTSWLGAKIQANVFNLFYTSTTKIPWTETGVAMVNQQIILALELGVTNGLIAPGYDNEGVFYPDGYKVISTDLSLMQSQKGTRIWEGSSFIAIGSGALQGAVISGSFVQ